MRTIKRIFPVLLLVLFAAVAIYAQTQRAYRGTFQSVRQLVLRIENRTVAFHNNLDSSLARSPINKSRAEEPDAKDDIQDRQDQEQRIIEQRNINSFVRDFDDAVHRLGASFDKRQSTASDAQEVLNRASFIDNFLRRHPLDVRTRNSWSVLRADLDQLAGAYGVSCQQTTRTYPPTTPASNQYPYSTNHLTGTYRLDVSRSDDPREAADRVTRNLPANNRDQLLNAITARLESPDQLAIDLRGRTVTIASSRAPQITFEADGVERVETRNNRTVRARASLSGEQLLVSSTGDRGNDFNVTFEPTDNGQRLSVTRRVYAEGLTQPVVVQSSYDRISDVAQFNIYNGPTNYPGPVTTNGDFIIPNGELVVATLNDLLSTSSAREGDRFKMTVRQPAQYEGATIEGHVSHVERSGRLTGRSVMTLNFDNIRLRDGSSYRFAGILESARSTTGDTVRVDNEGTVRDDSQTTKTEQRAAIGTAVGAIIGAIASGGKGAAIGAIVGAGGGAGSVYVQGRNDLELSRGTELTIRATGPVTNGVR